MKKILLSTFLILFVGTLVNAQIKVGVKGGLNVASTSYEIINPIPQYQSIETETSPLISFHLGGFFNYVLSDRFSTQVELMYSGQGVKVDFSDGFGNTIKTKNRLNYISIPFLGKYHSPVGITAEAGINFDILLSAKQIYDDSSTGVQGVQYSDSDIENLKGVDVKLLIGVGYELPSGLAFNLRYSGAIANSTDNPNRNEPEYIGEEETYNNVFQVSIGFPLYGN